MEVQIRKELINGILVYSRDQHPNEIILLLRGRDEKEIEVNEVVIPPFAIHGKKFSAFKPHMLPFDTSILGLVHSHPSGILRPSIYDLNHFYGRIMMVSAYPYRSVENIGVFDKKGYKIPFTIVS